MTKYYLLFTALLFCFSETTFSQQPADLTLPVTVSFQSSPPGIVLTWPAVTGATNITIRRKLKTDANWISTTTLPGSTVTYTDTNVITGRAYEYSIAGNSTPAKTTYIFAGQNIPAVHNRGKIILLTDNAYTIPLAASINQLIDDLTGDGWQVIRHIVSRTDSVKGIKNIIKNDYNADTANVKALFLLGHIPVPYSGDLNPDGHAEHRGAWPADVYYADLKGNYTDATTNDTLASSKRNWNVPGDGKFDQTFIPGTVMLQTGRVDLYNLPSISNNDTMLMQRYLQKDHAFRFKMLDPIRRTLIDDNFGYFTGEAFAVNGWRNSFALLGDTSLAKAGDYFTGMNGKSYLWSCGTGGGSYTSCSGVGNTSNFATDSVQNIFTMLFGSYFGDWDSQNNFLRAPLASKGWTLTNCWAGRPHWMFQHMGLGETIGFSTMITQNNSYTYLGNYGSKYVHIALMGDPSLRMDVVASPANLTATTTHSNTYTQLNWTASADAVSGYYVYRAASIRDSFTLLTPSYITANSYTDSMGHAGNQVYMVRAVKLENAYTGTYYNLSQGIMDSTYLSVGIALYENKSMSVELFPNPLKTSATLRLHTHSTTPGVLIITNVLGSEVKRLTLIPSANQTGVTEAVIERGNLKTGLYFYEVISKGEDYNRIIASGKLVVE